MAQSLPSINVDQRIAIQKYCAEARIMRDLSRDAKLPVISTGIPPFDYVFGNGGVPRGRIMEWYGKEATGKCVSADTYVLCEEKGILTLEELANSVSWSDASRKTEERTPDTATTAGCLQTHNTKGVVDVTHVYYAGKVETISVFTEQGHDIKGTPTHRVLLLTKHGLANWTTLENVRPGDLVFSLFATNVAGNQKLILDNREGILSGLDVKVDVTKAAYLMGALCTAEIRHEAEHLTVTSPLQRKSLEDAAQVLHIKGVYEPNPKWVQFTGLLKLSPKLIFLSKEAIKSSFLALVRQSSLETQKAWLSGFIYMRGQWTHGDLEIEVCSQEAARTMQAVSENLGVRWSLYPVLSTFADQKFKLALRSRSDQQLMMELLFKHQPVLGSWRARFSNEEDENHTYAQKTLVMAREMLEKAGVSGKVDVEDTSKENCYLVLQKLLPTVQAKSKMGEKLTETLVLLSDDRLCLDRITGSARLEKVPCYDLTVPSGHHYSTNTLISHNSTAAMHLCKTELQSRPDALVFYLDYERAMAASYAKALGLLAFQDRFLLLDPDTLEQADKLLLDCLRNKWTPSIVVVDSVAAATPSDLYGRDLEDAAPVAIRARKWAEILEKWAKQGGDYGTTFILLNQTRTHIVMGDAQRKRQIPGAAGAELEETPGGNAIKFYSSVRIRLEAQRVVMGDIFNPMTGETESIPIANLVKAFAIKNKCAPPYRRGSFFIHFGQGIDRVRTMYEIACNRDFIRKSNGYHKLVLPNGKEISVRGEESFLEVLKADKDAQEQLFKLLQWDKAEEMAADIKATSTVDLTGNREVEEEADVLAKVAKGNVTISMVMQAPSLVHKAEVLSLLERNGAIYVYKSSIGEQIRSRELRTLDAKIKGKEREILQAKVDAAVEVLRELQVQEQKPVLTEPLTQEVKEEKLQNGVEEVPKDVAENG